MNKFINETIESKLGLYITDIRESNYFNPRQNIVRVLSPFKKDTYYDFRLAPSFVPPNSKEHRALLLTSEDFLDPMGLTEEQLELAPGLEDEFGTLSKLNIGIVYLVDKNQRIYTIDNQGGSTGFSISNTNMFDQDKVRVSIAPPIPKGYTNNSQNEEDYNEIGLFMNDDTAILRSRGAQLTLGDEGIHIGGKVFWESTTHSKEIMQDNFIHQLIPSTLPTAAVSIPQLPNFGMISQIAATANKVINVINKASNISSALV